MVIHEIARTRRAGQHLARRCGGQIWVCGACAKPRGITEGDLIPGARIADGPPANAGRLPSRQVAAAIAAVGR